MSTIDASHDLDLVVTRTIAAIPHAVFRCWTEPALITQWFTPPPYKTIRAELDVRAGGASLVVMRAPDGSDIPSRGVYLEVVSDARLVLTDAFVSAWVPSDKPFTTLILTFAPDASGTLYTARVRHWTAPDRDAHLGMGFDQGWSVATDQLAALAATLA